MKKIILFTIIMCLFSIPAFAESKRIMMNGNNVEVATVCLHGFVFALASSKRTAGVSIIQVYKESNGKSVPIPCK